MSRIPTRPLTVAHDIKPVTVWLTPSLAARLKRIIDTTCATHPKAEPARIADLVMAAGIEAVERAAPPSTTACSSETRATRPATKPIAGPVGMNNPGSRGMC
tara:strand:- start:170 stop:475 length:306 start_codon:yes stop_codon:yes gene_type:complete